MFYILWKHTFLVLLFHVAVSTAAGYCKQVQRVFPDTKYVEKTLDIQL